MAAGNILIFAHSDVDLFRLSGVPPVLIHTPAHSFAPLASFLPPYRSITLATLYNSVLGTNFNLTASTNRMPVDFDKREYWHERFSSETKFEWLITSERFMAILEPLLSQLPKTSRILQLGSGNSDLHNHLRACGFANVTNIDYEPLAIERGRQLEKLAFGDVRMRYLVADATEIDPTSLCSEGRFDLVVDKSTADALSCGGNAAVMDMLRGVKECLDAEHGKWVSVSYSEHRFSLDENPFHVDVMHKVPTPKRLETDPDIFHWCYMLSP